MGFYSLWWPRQVCNPRKDLLLIQTHGRYRKNSKINTKNKNDHPIKTVRWKKIFWGASIVNTRLLHCSVETICGNGNVGPADEKESQYFYNQISVYSATTSTSSSLRFASVTIASKTIIVAHKLTQSWSYEAFCIIFQQRAISYEIFCLMKVMKSHQQLLIIYWSSTVPWHLKLIQLKRGRDVTFLQNMNKNNSCYVLIYCLRKVWSVA